MAPRIPAGSSATKIPEGRADLQGNVICPSHPWDKSSWGITLLDQPMQTDEIVLGVCLQGPAVSQP